MSPPVYLHIGMPKVGSTSLQLWCRENVEFLSDFGVHYPLFDRHDKDVRNQRFRSTGNGNALYLAFADRDNSWPAERRCEAVKEELERHREKAVLFSHELFLSLGREQLLEIVAFFKKAKRDARIIFFCRPQRDWLISDYQQHVKQLKETKSVQQHLARRMKDMDYLAFCRKFARVFEPENLEVAFFDPRIDSRDAITALLNILEIDTPQLSLSVPAAHNVSLNRTQVNLQRLLHRLSAESVKPDKRQALMKTLDRLGGDKDRVLLAPALEEFIRAYFLVRNEELLRDYVSEEKAKIYITSETDFLERANIDSLFDFSGDPMTFFEELAR